LASAVLVFWNLPTLGLSYWDEYNYIVTARWFLGIRGNVFHTYEGPVFPFFMSLLFRVFGVQDYVAIATSSLFAVMTVALLTMAGKKMFDTKVALIAPTLLTFTALFLIFSRLAMTDMAFTFFFTAANLAAYLALSRRKLADAILAGVLYAACTGVKYSGLLALLVPLAYALLLVLYAEKGQRLREGLRYLRAVLIMIIPNVLAGLLFLAFLGVGGSVRQLFSRHGLRQLTLGLPATLRNGYEKFLAIGWGLHSSQLNVVPLHAAPYYVQVLVTWDSVPVLILAIIGILTINTKSRSEIFTLVWAAVIFTALSSVTAYAREILPILPPLSILAALGLAKLPGVVQFTIKTLKPSGARLSVNGRLFLAVVVLALVLGSSAIQVVQTISVKHDAYREAGQLLREIAGNSVVLADTQLIIAYYYPVRFGNITASEIANVQYVIVDYQAVTHGNEAALISLQQQHRIELVASIHNDLYPIIYLDVTNFQHLQTWNYTDITIYRVVNATANP
jgi:4-amino-4-deoxy-L-arabinose transferase-like glycosyltransferase